ncbi:MAG: hypothetical protein AAFQ45_02045 [Pseudomonadota bacterium]
MISLGIGFERAIRLIGFSVLLAFVTMFAALFAGMAGYSVLTSIVPPKAPVWKEMRCALGLPVQGDQSCWQKRMSRLEAEKAKELAALSAKNNELDRLRSEASQKLKTIGTLEARFDEVNLFKQKRAGNVVVTTGVKYRGLTSGPKWVEAWCYTEVTDGDLSLKIALGKAAPETGIRPHKLSATERRKLGGSDPATLTQNCQWPLKTG